MRKIAFLSEKGGVGKSTLCVNIGAALAGDLGRKVLIVDLDGMACVSRTLAPQVMTFEESVGAALIGAMPLTAVVRQTAIPNLWLAAGSVALKTIEQWVIEPETESGRTDEGGRLSEMALALELSGVSADLFDYVLLDCPGGQPFMERAALLACDEVIVPTGLAAYDFYALTPTIELIVAARKARGDGAPRFLGFLPNAATAEGVPGEMLERLAKYEAPIFSPVRESRLLKSAPGWQHLEKRVVVLSRPKSQVAASIRQVAREIKSGIEVARQLAWNDPRAGELANDPVE